MKLFSRCGFLLSLVLSFSMALSCVTPPRYPPIGKLPSPAPDLYSVSDPLFLQDICLETGTAQDEEAFQGNLFVGDIRFSGGIITDRENGDITRALEHSLTLQAQYRDKARIWIDTALRDALKEKYRFRYEFPSSISRSDFRTETRTVFLKKDEIGSDNINIPVQDCRIIGISAHILSRLPESTPQYLLLPVIENWYSHSAGWFNDQAYGCGAGLRMTAHFLLIDTRSGAVLFREKIEMRVIEEYSSYLSVNELQRLFEEERLKIIPKIKRSFY